MSWTDALDMLKEYREDRKDSLNNMKGEKWFTYYVDDLSEMIDDVFGRVQENKDWRKLYDDKDDILKLQAEQLKTSFLSGSARDLRMMYAASEDNRMRSGMDHDRMEFMKSGFHLAKLEQLRDIVKGMEG